MTHGDASREDSNRRRLVSDAVDAARHQAVETHAPSDSPPLVHAGAPLPALPGYEIMREIHRGGQGVVYQALQKSTRRKVAIKVMREGPFAGPGDRARFDREVQILAALNHPNIVTIHDTGSHAGTFYFVMDYISGQPLDVFMASTQRSIAETLRLFERICAAVQVAHVRGVIHRDLKPSNIRVDPEGNPHILDFGLAKTVGLDSRDGGEFMTFTGQFVGSLPWASPEQAEGSMFRIDLRSDVYSLGVVLFQMLTGKFPYVVTGPMREVMDRILHAEPVRPRSLRPQIDDEVETIVLKCLSKDRDRRYQTAGELGRDVGRYLKGEPIEAKRDSFGYVMRKQLRRYKLPAGLAAAFIVLILAGLATSLTYWQRAAVEGENARKAERIAGIERDKAREAERAAGVERDKASEAAKAESLARARADAINEFITTTLWRSDPFRTGTAGITVAEAMKGALEKLDAGELQDQPETEASLRLTIARILNGNAQPAKALECAESALRICESLHGGDDPLRATALTLVGVCLESLGRHAEALPRLEEALAMRKRFLPPDDFLIGDSLNVLGHCLSGMGRNDEALIHFEESLAIQRRATPGDSWRMATSMNNVAAVLESLGRSAEALPLFTAALEMRERILGRDHPDIASDYNNVAACLESLGRSAEALPMYESALTMLKRLFPGDHHNIVGAYNNIAHCYLSLGRPADALKRANAGLKMARRLFDGDHPLIATMLSRRGHCRTEMQDNAKGLTDYQAALDMLKSLHAGDHPDIANALNGLAGCQHGLGRPSEALPNYTAALEMEQRLFAGDHPFVARELNNVANCQAALGNPNDALSGYVAALEMYQRLYRGDHPAVAQCLNNVAGSLYSQDRNAEAVQMFRESLGMLQRMLPKDHPHLLYPQFGLANALVNIGEFTEAEELLRAAVEHCERSPETRALHWTNVARSLASLYTRWNSAEPDKGHETSAARWRAEVVASSRPAASQP